MEKEENKIKKMDKKIHQTRENKIVESDDENLILLKAEKYLKQNKKSIEHIEEIFTKIEENPMIELEDIEKSFQQIESEDE